MEKSLTEVDQKKIESFKREINFDKPELLVQYGVSIQKNLSKFSEEMLTNVRNKEAQEVGALLNQMMLTVKGIDVNTLSNPGMIARFWNKFLAEISLFKGGFEKINSQLDNMISKLEESKGQLLSDVQKLDKTYEQNLVYHRDLELMIIAAEELIVIKQNELDKLAAEVMPDVYVEIQKLKDQRSNLQQFEKRIHDLKLTKTLTLQTLPQIRLIQHNNNELVNKIQTSILHTVPIWKNQIVLTLALQKQKKAAEVQKKINETTNELITKNSEMLKDSTIDIAKLSEQGIVETKSLQKVNDDLISTIGSVLQIYQEGREKRKEAEKELVEMERRLKVTLGNQS